MLKNAVMLNDSMWILWNLPTAKRGKSTALYFALVRCMFSFCFLFKSSFWIKWMFFSLKNRVQVYISIPFDWLWFMRGWRIFCASIIQTCYKYKPTDNGYCWATNMRIHNYVWSSGKSYHQIEEHRRTVYGQSIFFH